MAFIKIYTVKQDPPAEGVLIYNRLGFQVDVYMDDRDIVKVKDDSYSARSSGNPYSFKIKATPISGEESHADIFKTGFCQSLYAITKNSLQFIVTKPNLSTETVLYTIKADTSAESKNQIDLLFGEGITFTAPVSDVIPNNFSEFGLKIIIPDYMQSFTAGKFNITYSGNFICEFCHFTIDESIKLDSRNTKIDVIYSFTDEVLESTVNKIYNKYSLYGFGNGTDSKISSAGNINHLTANLKYLYSDTITGLSSPIYADGIQYKNLPLKRVGNTNNFNFTLDKYLRLSDTSIPSGKYFVLFIEIKDSISFSHPVSILWTSEIYQRADMPTPSTPSFSNLSNNQIFVNAYIGSDGNIVNSTITPMISVNDDYLYYAENITCQYRINNGKWISMNPESIQIQGPTAKPKLDADGNPVRDADGNIVYETDENGDPIIVKPAVNKWFFTTKVGIHDAGKYTIESRVTNTLNNKYSGNTVNIKINEHSIFYPTLKYTYGNTTAELKGTNLKFNGEVKVFYEADSRFSLQSLYNNNSPITNPSYFSEDGIYNITLTAVNAVTSESTSKTAKFTISNEIPPIIEVFGVTSNQTLERYTIDIIIPPNCEISYYVTTSAGGQFTPKGTIIDRLNEDGENSKAYRFYITDEGSYNLYITSTSVLSGINRNYAVTGFKVFNPATVAEGLVDIKPIYESEGTYPIAALGCIYPYSAENEVMYKVSNMVTSYREYLAPVLLLENCTFTGREKVMNTYNERSKKFDGIITYKPEIPRINGVRTNGIYYEPKTITFTNVATLPKHAAYYVFVDGNLINNPFDTSLTISTDGYHFIAIVGWDKVRPKAYSYYEMKFLIKAETQFTIRRPYIVVKENNKIGTAEATVNFPCKHVDSKHEVTIEYFDNTSEHHLYPSNIGKVNFTLKNNCVITAKTTLITSGLNKTDVKTINIIYEEKPPTDNIEIIGPVPDKIPDPSNPGQMIDVNICPGFIIDIAKDYFNDYEIYVNGNSYTSGTFITNHDEELRMYTIEVVITNPYNDKKSYYSNQILVDTISPAFPMLLNYKRYDMNHTGFNHRVDNSKPLLKKEDNLTDRGGEYRKYLSYEYSNAIPIANVDSFIFKQDDEYILSLTYIYYNGVKRTASYYFSINSTFLNSTLDISKSDYKKDSQYTNFTIEDLLNDNQWFRIIVKPIDYNNNDIANLAEDGELVIDRQNGHLYYSQTGPFKLIPMTSDVEEAIINVEKQLYNAEWNHLLFQYFYKLANNLAEYYQTKITELINKLKQYQNKLNVICTEIDKLESDVKIFISNVEQFEASIKNEANVTMKGDADLIKDLQPKIETLNLNFKKLVEGKVIDIFNKAGYLRRFAYQINHDIATKVTIEEFNNWKNIEEGKFSRTKAYFKNFYEN